jgi:hypothetical protein
MKEMVRLTPEEQKARNRRNLWIAVCLVAFMVLVFVVTLARLKAGVLDRPL